MSDNDQLNASAEGPGFFDLIAWSFKVFFYNFLHYFAFSLFLIIPIGALLVSYFFLQGILFSYAFLFPLLLFLVFLYSFVVGIGFVRLTTRVIRGEGGRYGSVLLWSFRKFFSYIALAFRVLWYSGAWLFIFIVILYSVFQFSVSVIGSATDMVAPSVYAADEQIEEILHPVPKLPSEVKVETATAPAIDSGGADLDSFWNGDSEGIPPDTARISDQTETKSVSGSASATFWDNTPDASMGYSFGFQFLGIINFILGILSLVIMIIIFIRIPRAFFSYYILADTGCSSKEALRRSVEITKGHWWQVVLYVMGASFSVTIPLFIIAFVLSLVLGKATLQITIDVLSIFIAYPIMIFSYGLYAKLDQMNTAQ